MESLKDIIKLRRKEIGLTLSDVAKACNVSEATVSRWESGEIGDMKRSRIFALSKVLKISPSVIVGDLEDEIKVGSCYINVPLYDKLCCGNGGFVEDNIISYVPISVDGLNLNNDYFCQYAQGDSMKDAGIFDGDLLVFEKSSYIENNQIGCFCIDENMATCKKYKNNNGIISLNPMNSSYDPIIIDISNGNFRCLGILKFAIKRF